MAFRTDTHRVYKKDGEGNTYAVAESVFENKILQHDQYFGNIVHTLKLLPQFKTRPDDIWIIDFMKSGTHWMLEIINLLTRDAVTKPLFDKQNSFLEMIQHVDNLEQLETPRIMNTHLHLKFMPGHILEKGKIVFVLRNPKSVAVSDYHHKCNIIGYEYEGSFSGYLPVFMDGMDELYGTWFDTVTTYWEYLKGKPNVHFVVYEELMQNPVKCIKEVSDFLGLVRDVKFCEHVAEESKFDAMRSREQEAMVNCQFLKGQDGFIRKGSTTEWKTYFTVAQNEMFDAVYEDKMKDYPDLKDKIRFS